MTVVDYDYSHSDEEFKEMWNLLVESYSIVRKPHNWLFSRLEDWKYGGNSQTSEGNPAFFQEKVRLWRDEGGKLVGFCISEYGGNTIEIQIHPHYRHIEEAMFAWIQDIWARDKERVETFAYLYDRERQRLLARLGYQDMGDAGYMRRYDLSRNYPAPKLEAGFRIQTLAENRNYDSLLEAVNSAFDASFERAFLDFKSTAPSYSFDLDFSVISPEGKHVAFCLGWIDPRNRVAEIDPVGTHADYRRRGFAKAVVTACFWRLREMGVEYAYIGSGPEPYVANRLYESLNPVERYQVNRWIKELK